MIDDIALAGGDWDRAAAWRSDPGRQAESWATGAVLPVWRGRPLLTGDADTAGLGWLAPGHPVLTHGDGDAPLFLGLWRGQARFAVDVSSWEPPALDQAAMAMFHDPGEYRHPALPGDHRFAELRGVLTALDPTEGALAATARALFNWHRSHGFCAVCGQPSTVAQAGWQRRCGACQASHFPRTDPVVIMLVRRGNRALLGRSPGWPAGMYSALAGFVEPGETPEQAVRREVLEETGIRTGAVGYLGAQPWPWPNSLMLGMVADALDDAITVDAELDDARWITREDMVRVFAGIHPDIRAPRLGAIAHALLHAWVSGRV